MANVSKVSTVHRFVLPGHSTMSSVPCLREAGRVRHLQSISARTGSRGMVSRGSLNSSCFGSSSRSTMTEPLQPQQQQVRSFTSLNESTPFQLCFLRHGQSTWNRDNRFIGWTDTPLTEDGVVEAQQAGQMLSNSGMQFDEVHTSLLRRSIRTANICLMELGQEYLPVMKDWRLNERSYGALVGKNKKEVVKLFGKEQVMKWRRSYDVPPPSMEDDHKYHPRKDPRYRMMLDKIPKAESLKQTLARSSNYWDEVLAPALLTGKTLLICGHENNLRSLIMRLEGISEEDVIKLNLPRAIPLAYRLDENLQPVGRMDGKLDEATGFLRGHWLSGDQAVSDILDRDHKQVYDTTIDKNLEIHSPTENLLIGNKSHYTKSIAVSSSWKAYQVNGASRKLVNSRQ